MRRFNGVELTEETIIKTREWFAQNCLDCIEEAESGEVSVNDLDEYRKWRLQSREDDLSGKNDHTVTFLQRAYFIQTGECVALLPMY